MAETSTTEKPRATSLMHLFYRKFQGSHPNLEKYSSDNLERISNASSNSDLSENFSIARNTINTIDTSNTINTSINDSNNNSNSSLNSISTNKIPARSTHPYKIIIPSKITIPSKVSNFLSSSKKVYHRPEPPVKLTGIRRRRSISDSNRRNFVSIERKSQIHQRCVLEEDENEIHNVNSDNENDKVDRSNRNSYVYKNNSKTAIYEHQSSGSPITIFNGIPFNGIKINQTSNRHSSYSTFKKFGPTTSIWSFLRFSE